jgi:hypothetical protein
LLAAKNEYFCIFKVTTKSIDNSTTWVYTKNVRWDARKKLVKDMKMLPTYMYDATPEQIGQAYKCFEGSQPFYKVVNSKNEYDAEGHLIEYTVKARYDVEAKEWVFSCTCECGHWNFHNVKHESKVCWHVRAALACAQEEKKALREMSAKVDAEKAAATEPVTEEVAAVVVAEIVTHCEDMVTEVVNQQVTPNVTRVTSATVPAATARELRAKTANRAAQWNNGHQSTLTEREKWLYTAKPAAHMRKPEPVVKGSLYSKPFSFYR